MLCGGQMFECVLDTGFDGALILPAFIVESLNLPIVARLVFELVGGAQMPASVALGEIEWLGEQRTVEVILSESNDALIGTEMCAGAKLVIDYANCAVSIVL